MAATPHLDQSRDAGPPYLRALRAHWRLIIFVVSIAVGTAAGASLLAEKRYEAEADILVTPVQLADDTFIGIPVLRETDQGRSVVTAARLVKTPEMDARVRTRLEGTALAGINPLRHVDAVPQEQSNVVTIVGKHNTAAGAAVIANAFAEELVAERTESFQSAVDEVVARLQRLLDAIPKGQRDGPEALTLQQRLAELQSLTRDPTLDILSEAVPPGAPTWPRPVLSIVVALLAALLLAVAAAIALELRNPRIYDEEELLLEHRLPILARVPKMRDAVVRQYIAGLAPLPGDVREAYRTLRTSLATAGPDRKMPKVIVVTSASPGEGKTLTSMNLALTIARAGSRVVLIDGDLRRPMLATVFGVPVPRATFANVLLGKATVAEALRPAPGYGDLLNLLLSTPEHGYTIDFLQTNNLDRVIAEIGRHADVIVIDSAPLGEVSDALTLADAADAVIVAVRIGFTRSDKLGELQTVLTQRGITPAGFVVTTRGVSQKHTYYTAPDGAMADAEPNGNERLHQDGRGAPSRKRQRA